MSNKFNQIISLASMLVLIWSGCKPGLDVTALKLKADEVVDYGALIKTKLSPGTRAYGLLKKDYNLSSENRIQGELDKILDALSAIQQLDPNIPNTNDFIAEYRNLFTRVISPMLVGIEKSSEKAAKLANNMAGVVASDSNLRKDIEKLKRAWAGAAGAAGSRDSFNLQSGIVLSSAERIYQMAVLYSQAKVQADFYEKLSGIRAAFDTLETKLGAALTFENSHERSQALAEFNLLEGILSSLESIASKITSTARVSESINEIGLQLMRKLGVLGLNPGINDEIKIAQEKVQKALNFNKLRVENVQNVKVVVDPELQKLQKEAFSGAVVVPTIAAEIKQDTDLNIFMRTLGANTIVATKNIAGIEQFIEALELAIASGEARKFDLFVNSVYGFNAQKLLENKALLKMSDKQFSNYLNSLAKDLNEEKTNKGELAQAFVLFTDKFGGAIDWSQIAKTLSQGNSKVVFVSADPRSLPADDVFDAKGLSLSEAYVVAEATSSSLIASMLVKAWKVLAPNSLDMNLQSIPEVVADVVRHLGVRQNPKDIANTVIEILGQRGLPVADLKTNVFADDFSTIETNLKKNHRFYRYPAAARAPGDDA